MMFPATIKHAVLAATILAIVIATPLLAEPPGPNRVPDDVWGRVIRDTFDSLFNDGYAAYERGDYETAHKLFLSIQGDARAQAFLGSMYHQGHGVTQNYPEAVKWYRKSADQGIAQAQTMLGILYSNGRGVPQNYIEAKKWHQKAASRGDALAQFHLGEIYMLGHGAPKDVVKAHMWFNLAASRGNAKVAALAQEGRDNVAKLMTPAQISQAQQLASEWKPK